MERRPSRSSPAPAAYRIRLLGCVDARWADWFGGLSLTEDRAAGCRPVSTLTGLVPDQAALRGIMNKLWDLNLTLITVERLTPLCESEVHDEQHASPGTSALPSGH